MQYLFHLPSYVWHGVCLSVFVCGNYVGHWVCLLFLGITLAIGFVCLSVVWVTYVWHCICMLFLGIMFCIAFVCLLVG